MDGLLQQALTQIVEEQRRQTKALNDMGCMVFIIATVIGVGALLTVASVLFGGYR